MLDTFKEVIANQFDAAFSMLNACIDKCPETVWNSRIANYLFCQVAFHVLFWTDFYLGQNEEAFRQQRFHRAHEHFFGDYEEFEDRAPVSLYDKTSISAYLQHCRRKVSEVVAAETAETLGARSGFERRAFSRAELHIYNIRHIQHHTVHLSLRLRLDANQGIPWIGSGWRRQV